VKVPTPIEDERRPDLDAAAQNLAIVRKVIRKGAIVVYESTVYPGGHKEDCSWCSGGQSAGRPDVASPWAIA
jgi:UDP-N-acetyl-D-galactosamine dehydrogenase